MIIGLTGKKESGKDTAAAHLIENNGFVRVAFADVLKDSVAALFDISRDRVEQLKNLEYARVNLVNYGPEQRTFAMLTFREFLQRYGTEAHRDVFGDQFWLDATRGRVDRLLSGGYDLVFTDVRFDNEAGLIRQLGGTVVEVLRPGINHPDNHASEQLPEADTLLWNDGTLGDLELAVTSLYRRLDR